LQLKACSESPASAGLFNYAGVPMITLKLNGQDHPLDVTEDMPLLRASLPVRYQLQGWQKAEF
jgi:hypothetical protein